MMIDIYHFVDGRSDKIWAIDMDSTQPGVYTVWFGRRTNTLTTRQVSTNEPLQKIQSKLNKGYQRVNGSIQNNQYRPTGMSSAPTPLVNSPPPPKVKKKKPAKMIVDLSKVDSDAASSFF
ncbi:MAG: hypothetical protein H8D23_00735 [Candidatus Brocadiales bacterium]|nr:hypothetical protein [Candidatus Brocadiales bacterium]